MLVSLKAQDPQNDTANIPPLRHDDRYVVLEIYAKFQGATYFRIDPMDGSAPALFDSHHFRVTSTAVPSAWVAECTELGSLYLRPAEWGRDGFWESFFDDEEWARIQYSNLRDRIIAESQA